MDRLCALLIVAGLLVSCCPSSQYSGDGHVEDRGCWPFPNYRVRFGHARLDRTTTARYHIRRLPKIAAVVGLHVTTPQGVTCEQLSKDSRLDGSIAIEVRRADGARLAAHSAPIRAWVWSYAASTPSPASPPQECFVYADDLFLGPKGLEGLDVSFSVQEAAHLPIDLVPAVESFAIYTP